jgi:hypothetical protein
MWSGALAFYASSSWPADIADYISTIAAMGLSEYGCWQSCAWCFGWLHLYAGPSPQAAWMALPANSRPGRPSLPTVSSDGPRCSALSWSQPSSRQAYPMQSCG